MEGFRNFVKGPLGKGLLVLFTIPFAVIGIESYFTGSSAKNVSQVVNGDVISTDELDTQIKALREGYLQQVQGDASLLNEEFIKKAALNNLTLRRLLIQQTEKLGIILSQAQVEQMLTQVPSFQEDGVFSPTKYEAYLKHINSNNQEFVNGVRQDRAIEVLINSLNMSLLNPHDMQQRLNLLTEQRHVYLASIPFSEYIKDVTVSQSEIESYYQQHKNQFVQLPKVKVEYLLLPAAHGKTDVNVSDAELQQAYQQYQQSLPKTIKHILITTETRNDAEAKKRADEAYAKIQAGSSFNQIASEYSEDIDSKDKGGVIANYTEGAFPESFDKAVKSVTVGQVSAPIKTDFGYHLILAEQATPASLESVKAQLVAQVQKQKSENAQIELVNRLNELAVSSDSLETIKQEVQGSTIEVADDITPKSKHPILSQTAVKQRLFGEDVKKGDRHVSGNIQLANGDQVWVKVTQYTPAGIPELAQITEQVKQKVIYEKAMQMAKAKVQTTLDAFKDKPAQEVLASGGIKFEDAGLWERGKHLPEVQQLAFSLTPPKEGHWTIGTTSLDQELLIVAIGSVKSRSTQLSAEQQQQLQAGYTQMRANQELNDYTEYLKSKATIKQGH